jgi:DnaJ-class molecular chaperone
MKPGSLLGMTHNKYQTRVIICPDCGGNGKVYIDKDDRSVFYQRKTCETCKGSGRLIRKITVEFMPYVESEAPIVKL